MISSLEEITQRHQVIAAGEQGGLRGAVFTNLSKADVGHQRVAKAFSTLRVLCIPSFGDVLILWFGGASKGQTTVLIPDGHPEVTQVADP
ncbi:MAG: hypothetical protein ACI9W4_000946 [Rhodothermales bacterium]